jgi:two-component system CheB/CheR fusion protein
MSDIHGGTDEVRGVFERVETLTGHAFTLYGRPAMLRGLQRRVRDLGLAGLQAYRERLDRDPDEAPALLGELVPPLTGFFRGILAFEALAAKAIPAMFDRALERGGRRIRVWVPGCATGEEALSIAMLLIEEAERRGLPPDLQVVGSDLHQPALEAARRGVYPTAIEAEVGRERLERFFVREMDGWRVRGQLHAATSWFGHNLLRDRPYSELDLISCRNLMVYLSRPLREQLVGRLHRALNPGGYLLLGGAETPEKPTGLFQPVDRAARLFQAV